MIIKKKNAKGDTVRVTFELPGEAAEEQAAVVGSFNNWDPEANPMTFVKSRKVWKEEVKFTPGDTVEFRYYVDGKEWKNEEEADGVTQTPYFSENSVLEL